MQTKAARIIILGAAMLMAPLLSSAQSADGSAQPQETTAAEPTSARRAEEPAALEPAVDVSTSAPASESAPAESAPAAPAAPAPQPVLYAAEPEPAAPAAPMPAENQEREYLVEAQEVVEQIAEVAPKPIQPYLYALGGALGGIIAVLGVQQALKRMRKRRSKTCSHCGGTGCETEELCIRCKGEGTIEQEFDASAECPHCKGDGSDPCHACEGTGKKHGEPCEACGGSGKTPGATEGESIACCVCKGIGEAELSTTKKTACPDCGGKGRP
jgi:hypothetical protein